MSKPVIKIMLVLESVEYISFRKWLPLVEGSHFLVKDGSPARNENRITLYLNILNIK